AIRIFGRIEEQGCAALYLSGGLGRRGRYHFGRGRGAGDVPRGITQACDVLHYGENLLIRKPSLPRRHRRSRDTVARNAQQITLFESAPAKARTAPRRAGHPVAI